MFIVNTDYISGKELEMLGIVKGSTIQSKHLGKDISQGFKTLVGGELKAYTEMMNDARALATERMKAEATAMGADAIVNVYLYFPFSKETFAISKNSFIFTVSN